MHNLGLIYEHGGHELDRNYLQKAASWYEKATNINYAGSMIRIGELSYKGKGVTKNYKTARRWFEKAIEVSDDKSEERLRANFWLGKMMMKGQGGTEDIKG